MAMPASAALTWEDEFHSNPFAERTEIAPVWQNYPLMRREERWALYHQGFNRNERVHLELLCWLIREGRIGS